MSRPCLSTRITIGDYSVHLPNHSPSREDDRLTVPDGLEEVVQPGVRIEVSDPAIRYSLRDHFPGSCVEEIDLLRIIRLADMR